MVLHAADAGPHEYSLNLASNTVLTIMADILKKRRFKIEINCRWNIHVTLDNITEAQMAAGT